MGFDTALSTLKQHPYTPGTEQYQGIKQYIALFQQYGQDAGQFNYHCVNMILEMIYLKDIQLDYARYNRTLNENYDKEKKYCQTLIAELWAYKKELILKGKSNACPVELFDRELQRYPNPLYDELYIEYFKYYRDTFTTRTQALHQLEQYMLAHSIEPHEFSRHIDAATHIMAYRISLNAKSMWDSYPSPSKLKQDIQQIDKMLEYLYVKNNVLYHNQLNRSGHHLKKSAQLYAIENNFHNAINELWKHKEVLIQQYQVAQSRKTPDEKVTNLELTLKDNSMYPAIPYEVRNVQTYTQDLHAIEQEFTFNPPPACKNIHDHMALLRQLMNYRMSMNVDMSNLTTAPDNFVDALKAYTQNTVHMLKNTKNATLKFYTHSDQTKLGLSSKTIEGLNNIQYTVTRLNINHCVSLMLKSNPFEQDNERTRMISDLFDRYGQKGSPYSIACVDTLLELFHSQHAGLRICHTSFPGYDHYYRHAIAALLKYKKELLEHHERSETMQVNRSTFEEELRKEPEENKNTFYKDLLYCQNQSYMNGVRDLEYNLINNPTRSLSSINDRIQLSNQVMRFRVLLHHDVTNHASNDSEKTAILKIAETYLSYIITFMSSESPQEISEAYHASLNYKKLLDISITKESEKKHISETESAFHDLVFMIEAFKNHPIKMSIATQKSLKSLDVLHCKLMDNENCAHKNMGNDPYHRIDARKKSALRLQIMALRHQLAKAALTHPTLVGPTAAHISPYRPLHAPSETELRCRTLASEDDVFSIIDDTKMRIQEHAPKISRPTPLLTLYSELIADSVNYALGTSDPKITRENLDARAMAVWHHPDAPFILPHTRSAGNTVLANALITGLCIALASATLVIALSFAPHTARLMAHIASVFARQAHGYGISWVGSTAKDLSNFAVSSIVAATLSGALVSATATAAVVLFKRSHPPTDAECIKLLPYHPIVTAAHDSVTTLYI